MVHNLIYSFSLRQSKQGKSSETRSNYKQSLRNPGDDHMLYRRVIWSAIFSTENADFRKQV